MANNKYRSPPLKSLHEVAKDLHAFGAVDDATMQRFDASCQTERPAWQSSNMTADQFDRAIAILFGDGGAKAMARALSRYHPSGASENTIARLVSRLRNDRDNIPAWIADGVVDMLDRTAKECAALADEIKSRERSPHSRNGGNPYS
jgi:hypothetical protein